MEPGSRENNLRIINLRIIEEKCRTRTFEKLPRMFIPGNEVKGRDGSAG
jgi:hypothetical protein